MFKILHVLNLFILCNMYYYQPLNVLLNTLRGVEKALWIYLDNYSMGLAQLSFLSLFETNTAKQKHGKKFKKYKN